MSPYRRGVEALDPMRLNHAQYREELLFHVFFLLVCLIPLVGFALHGSWSQGELGLATVAVIFAGREIATIVAEARRDRRGRAQ